MSSIQTVTGIFECDTPGCPCEFRIDRWKRRKNDEITHGELLEAAAQLLWKVDGRKAFCRDCQRQQRKATA